MKKFMFIFGPLSSCFDFITFGILIWVLGATGATFQTGWFLESIATQTIVVLVIRSRNNVYASKPSPALAWSAFGAVVVGWILTYSFIGPYFSFTHFNWLGLLPILAIVAIYLAVVEVAKKAFYRRYGALIEK